MKRDTRGGPWRPLPTPRRALWRYRLAAAVAVFRDQLEVAGVFPFRRYFWAPRIEDDGEVEFWAQYAARARATRERIAKLGPNPSMNDLLKAHYASDAIDALSYSGNSLARMAMRTQTTGARLVNPIVFGVE